ncbi:Uncharacterized protein OBRU01_26355 [Operophtera brumata]|uniref:Uncharacterized protein n=1 Tax=Operophtera brumata TaxID=104452 RepID=A0A0L7K421_OPEBR|nr:Uncharacterized protein OBRU01_26355 [Operophtera brumata]
MNISYSYKKTRKDFGRQPMFCEVPAHLADSINPDVSEQRKYGLRNPVHQQSQASTLQSEHYINTKQVLYQERAINHTEGGWPKDIPFYDEELTAKLRKRVERDDAYIDAVINSYPNFIHYMDQNNATEMYEMYFKKMPSVKPVEKYSLQVNNAYNDPDNRPISCLSWTLEDNPKLVAAYCNKKFPGLGPVNSNLTCFVWDLENPKTPSHEFVPPTACWQVVCSPVTPTVLIGGLEDGRVCLFDIRVQKEPVMISPIHLAHRDPVSALLYTESRLNFEFFSGSTDGMCMWWDVRNVSNPIAELIMSVRIPPGDKISLANAEGVSALQYDRALPTRFLCGTDTGLVINVNRKGKSYKEIMCSADYAHRGPVKAVHRSPCTMKMFITCSDWTVHIWSDEVHTSPIITGMPHHYQINDVVWAPQRVSSYMSVSADGKLRYWDLLRKYREPVIVKTVSKNELLKIKPNVEGQLVAVGDSKGVMYILSLSENLVESVGNDKQLMLQCYERETRREHILETRVKEINLKLKAKEDTVGASYEVVDEAALLQITEDEYRRAVKEEMLRTGMTPQNTSPTGGRGDMRQR